MLFLRGAIIIGIAPVAAMAVFRCLTAVASNPSASKIATLRTAMVSTGNSNWLRAFALSKVVFVGALGGFGDSGGLRGPPTIILETVAAREGLIS